MEKRVLEVIHYYGGYLTSKQAREAGLTHTSLLRAVSAGLIDRVAHGVYELPSSSDDIFYLKQLRRPKAVYSHGTALFLHGLTDRDPLVLTVTVPSGYNTKQLIAEGFNIFTVKNELHSVGAVTAVTPHGNIVHTYSKERTICDCLRSRNRMDVGEVTGALKQYVRLPDRDIGSLMQMASLFRVSRILRPYLEVLL
jgi:predicted transcriptional regulator of viral defense system